MELQEYLVNIIIVDRHCQSVSTHNPDQRPTDPESLVATPVVTPVSSQTTRLQRRCKKSRACAFTAYNLSITSIICSYILLRTRAGKIINGKSQESFPDCVGAEQFMSLASLDVSDLQTWSLIKVSYFYRKTGILFIKFVLHSPKIISIKSWRQLSSKKSLKDGAWSGRWSGSSPAVTANNAGNHDSKYGFRNANERDCRYWTEGMEV